MEEVEFKLDKDVEQDCCEHNWRAYNSPEYCIGYIATCSKCGLEKTIFKDKGRP